MLEQCNAIVQQRLNIVKKKVEHSNITEKNMSCFRPHLCTLFRLNWAKQAHGTMR